MTPAPETLCASAAEFAAGAGRLLLALFGKQVEVTYKNKAKTDPVSEADRASQEYLSRAIAERYPDHGILGEEKPEDKDQAKQEGAQSVPDYLWVLDPLDGTKNFLNGLSVWGCSVAVLHKGAPVAGAIFTPEPSSGGKGTIYRTWRGGGAWRGDHPIQVADDPVPTAKRIASLPGSHWTQFRPTGPLRKQLGEVRAPGSIAYELALVARGGLHYALFGAPSIWDVAAGVLLVQEAGGGPLIRQPGSDRWSPFTFFFPENDGPKNLDAARKWHRSLLAGNPELTRFISRNLKKVNRPRLWYGRKRPPG